MPFIYQRTIRFQDTDAAGVVYFANVLTMCHEAYEESLLASGINLKLFFSNPAVAIPIVHADVDFLRPLFCGDQVIITLVPQHIGRDQFEIAYAINTVGEQRIAKAVTMHVCINAISRTKQSLPSEIMEWFERWSTSTEE